jgi:small subunit ribosomal protein S6
LRTYEALYIISPDVDDAGIQTVVQGVENLVTENGGTIVRESDVWGRRRLAYTVKKFTEGIYVLLRFQAGPTFIEKLELHYRLNEHIFRHLVTMLDERTLKLEIEQQKRDAELAQNAANAEDRDDEDDDRGERGGRRNRYDD